MYNPPEHDPIIRVVASGFYRQLRDHYTFSDLMQEGRMILHLKDTDQPLRSASRNSFIQTILRRHYITILRAVRRRERYLREYEQEQIINLSQEDPTYRWTLETIARSRTGDESEMANAILQWPDLTSMAELRKRLGWSGWRTERAARGVRSWIYGVADRV